MYNSKCEKTITIVGGLLILTLLVVLSGKVVARPSAFNGSNPVTLVQWSIDRSSIGLNNWDVVDQRLKAMEIRALQNIARALHKIADKQ